MRLGARLRGPKDSTRVGAMRRVLISNIECYNAPQKVCSLLTGIPGHAIEDVKLANIYVEAVGGAPASAAALQLPEKESGYPDPTMFGMTPACGFYLRHMRNVEMSHVEIATQSPDGRPAFSLNDVQRADFFAITAPRTSQGAFALHGVKDLRIGWSRAAADANLANVTDRVL